MTEALLSVATGDTVADRWSAMGQIGSMAIAVAIGRYAFRSRVVIWLVAFLGTAGAMLANILVDGQGAFLMVCSTPILYFLAVVGRDMGKHHHAAR